VEISDRQITSQFKAKTNPIFKKYLPEIYDEMNAIIRELK
jgi:hypothetical protein